jgi:hypothetical protein
VLTVSENTIYETTRAVVAESPERIYKAPEGSPYEPGMCLYSHGDVPGCLVGQVLHRLGVPLAEFHKHEGQPAGVVMSSLINIVGNDTRAGQFLDAAQGQQDSGEKWADALTAAEAYLPSPVTV